MTLWSGASSEWHGGGGGRGKREGPRCPAAVGSCFRRNDEVGVGNDGGWLGEEEEGKGPPGPTRFFVAGPPQNDMWCRGLFVGLEGVGGVDFRLL